MVHSMYTLLALPSRRLSPLLLLPPPPSSIDRPLLQHSKSPPSSLPSPPPTQPSSDVAQRIHRQISRGSRGVTSSSPPSGPGPPGRARRRPAPPRGAPWSQPSPPGSRVGRRVDHGVLCYTLASPLADALCLTMRGRSAVRTFHTTGYDIQSGMNTSGRWKRRSWVVENGWEEGGVGGGDTDATSRRTGG
ncbi:hypothetical protein M427DRAFT_46404 [Gonapodya prolifera JEL478]|uniref:Uncharacterized protein n=1 Tax=Gonapodya prolifera (strain JEL478) TaxID=1344416 RepID=A0A139A652_GONPJ|nr:hypothetical protein M427DRAFT_46404 [Gonapodya prolifera JEL478]|eukprot:KXS12282.1 hypothetical protein M427DRAFT_46404 [Gonapodya prolifera JEL478]